MWARMLEVTVRQAFNVDDLRELGTQVRRSLTNRHGHRGVFAALDAPRTRFVALSLWDAQEDIQRSMDVFETIGGILRALGGSDREVAIDVLKVIAQPEPASGQPFVSLATVSPGMLTEPELSALDARAHEQLLERHQYRGRYVLVDTDTGRLVHIGLWRQIGSDDVEAVSDGLRAFGPAGDEDQAIVVDVLEVLGRA